MSALQPGRNWMPNPLSGKHAQRSLLSRREPGGLSAKGPASAGRILQLSRTASPRWKLSWSPRTVTANARKQKSNSRRAIWRAFSRSREQLSERLAARQTELISVTDQRKSVEQELQQKRSALHENRHALDQLRSEYHA